MNHEFKNILDDDEHIIKTFKPNKFKFVLDRLFAYVFVWLLIFGVITLMFLFPDEDGFELPVYSYYIALGVLLVGTTLLFLGISISYKKRFYAYSNKRILVQSGFIGIDFKGLDHKMIGATEVKVDFLDKLLKRDTGTLKFGSQASPMGTNIPSMFIFTSVEKPYDTYKEIKKYIDEVKQEVEA